MTQMQMPMQARMPVATVGPSTARMRALVAACALVVLGVAIESGIQAVTNADKLLFIVPLVAVCGMGLLVLGIVNFELFAFTTIVLRASMDIAKPTSQAVSQGGTASAS